MKRIQLEDPDDFLIYRDGSGGPNVSIELFEILISSERGKGKGRKLIDLLRKEVKTKLIYAFTRESNYIAREFYSHVGFKPIGTVRKFYQDTGEDAIIYGANQ